MFKYYQIEKLLAELPTNVFICLHTCVESFRSFRKLLKEDKMCAESSMFAGELFSVQGPLNNFPIAEEKVILTFSRLNESHVINFSFSFHYSSSLGSPEGQC